MGKRKGKKLEQESSSEWKKDERFQHVATDPTFRLAPRKETKTIVDDRFSAMFTDKDFVSQTKTDKRGRPVHIDSKDNLKRFYGLEDDLGEKEVVEDESDEEESVSEDEASSASSDDSGSLDDDAASDVQEPASTDAEEELDMVKDAPDIEEATARLAVVKMDWENVKASDIFMILQSCRPDGGIVKKVTIYPSDFGMKRMAEERLRGPPELRASAQSKDDEASLSKRLRRHQVARLWYYYAVVECDCAATAAYIFEQCAGKEFETSGIVLQLSFVPDDMEFDVPEEWKDSITSCSQVESSTYKPNKFMTSSLSRTKVDLTWDETPKERTMYLQSLFDKEEFNDEDEDLKRLSEFVAFGSSDEDDEEVIAPPSKSELSENSQQKTASETDKKEIPVNNRKRLHRQKLREKMKKRKLQKANLLGKEGGSDEEGLSDSAPLDELTLLVSDRKAGPTGVTPSEISSDSRFGALFTDSAFHIDPTHPDSKRCTSVLQLVSAKRKSHLHDAEPPE